MCDIISLIIHNKIARFHQCEVFYLIRFRTPILNLTSDLAGIQCKFMTPTTHNY